ncbi:MAG: membrane protein insertase YidC [Bifidobacteriaceae bacterium]|jgi:YidC/Oxa1 family membrane protein insertase|nr:membrane protein insertase YidC [Bifidobacteriaceae bacterium]
MDWLDPVLAPIMWVVAWIMYGAHWLGRAVFLGNSVAWILSIVVLVVVMRIIMIPLFVKQIKSSRGMQLLQPELQKIQKRYKGKTDPVSRRRMQEETMALYKSHGSNPMSGCWPVLAQSPLFFALFRVLYSLGQLADGTYKNDSIGPITQDVAKEIQATHLFGAPLSATFLDEKTWAGASPVAVRIVTVILIILMSVTTFTTQRQLTMKNMPQTAMDNPMFRTQKMMMYMMPGIFAVSGVNFPIGVLIYWFTTNVWSMGQQFFVIRNMPAPGSEAEKRMEERKERRRLRKGLPSPDEANEAASSAKPAPTPTQRAQPRRTTRSQRRSGPLQAANPSPRPDDPRRELEPSDAEPGPAESAANSGAKSGAKPSAKKKTAGKNGVTKAGPNNTGASQAGARPAAGGKTTPSRGSGANDGSGAATASANPKVAGTPGQRVQPKKKPRKKRK